LLQDANNALTTTQYDELLEAWAAQDVQPNVPWHFGDAQYTVETIADWYRPRGGSSLSIINNKLVSIANSTATFGAAQQIDNLIVGNAYKIVGTATCSNSSAEVHIRASTDLALAGSSSSQDFSTNATGSVTANDTFIATATTLYVGTVVVGAVANDTVTIDAGITVKEITNYTEANAASEIEYSQENVFGSEEVVNGDFATDLNSWANTSSWWQWVDGRAYHAYSTSYNPLQQFGVIPPNSSVRVKFQHEVLQGEGRLTIGGTGGSVYFTLIGTDSIDFIHTNTTNSDEHIILARQSSVGFAEFYVDNISIKEITNAVEYKNIPQSARELYSLEDDTWVGSNELVVNGDFDTDLSGWSTTEGDWYWSNGSARLDGNGAFQALQSALNFMQTGVTYNITVSVFDLSGSLAVTVNNLIIQTITTNGTHNVIYTSTGNHGIQFKRTSGVLNVNIDNVSIKEIIEVAS